MDFAEAWAVLAIGDSVTVSDGTPPPSANVEGWAYRCWLSHNFSGTLAAKNDDPRRSFLINLPAAEDGSVNGYVVAEGVGHSFSVGE